MRRVDVYCVALRLFAVAMLLLQLLPYETLADGSVRVRPATLAPTVDASLVVRTFSLDEGGPAFDHNASYALADTARFSRATWDCGAWGTQGAVITQKILSLGGSQHTALVRRWLLNTPVIGDTGEAFSTEGGQFHMGADGKWEANAELIISALLYAKHAGAQRAGVGQPRAVFLQPVNRMVCAVFSDGTRTLLTPGAVTAYPHEDMNGLCYNDTVIAELETPSSRQHDPSVFASTMTAAHRAYTEGLHQNASGVALFQEFTIPSPYDDPSSRRKDRSKQLVGVSIPLRQYKSLQGQPCWPIRALVFVGANSAARDNPTVQQSTLVHSQLINNVTRTAWVDLKFLRPQSAGRYRIELWPEEGLDSRSDSIFTSAAWISTTSTVNATPQALRTQELPRGGSLTFKLGSVPGQANSSVEVPATLGERLAAAMKWQLRYAAAPAGTEKSTSRSRIGVLTIPQANWRGVGADNVGAASAMWDLIRSGYQDSWINVRFIRSISAMLELQKSGLVQDGTVTEDDLATAKASFLSTFGRHSHTNDADDAGAYLSWIGCDRVVAKPTRNGLEMTSACSDTATSSLSTNFSVSRDGLVPIGLGLIPALAAAASLNLTGGRDGLQNSLERFDHVREAARDQPGRFRTNTVPIERVNVSLWRASSSWHQRDRHGFARRTPDSGGDWQIFAPGDGSDEDGYGQYGNTEENGGIVLSTTALVFESGPYPQMYSDFAALVDVLTAIAQQLDMADGGVASGPLLAHNRSYLRRPMASKSIPQKLCMAARRLPNDQRYPPDRWSERWCDYYKSVSYNLPGAGAFVYSFAKGLLQINIPIVDDSVHDPSVTVWGTTVLGGGIQQRVAIPQWAIARWPVELLQGFTIDVVGLNVGGQPYTLECDTWCNRDAWKSRSSQTPKSARGVGHDPSRELCCTLESTSP